MDLHGHVIIPQSPRLTSGFTLGVVHPVGLDKCIMMCAHHCRIIQNSFTALKILCALSFHPYIPPNLWQPLIFLLSP